MASQRKQVSASRSDRTENNRQEAGKKYESSTSKVFCEENIDFIDKELRKLNKFCLKSGYSVAQIVKFARPFTQTSTTVKRKKWKKIGLIGVLMIVVAVVGFQLQSSCRIASALAKTAMIKIQPFWDWTRFYHSNCLVANPMYRKPDKLTMDDCQICEGIQDILRMSHVNPANIIDKYFKRDIPVIVEDGLRDWGHLADKSVQDIAEMYRTSNILKTSWGCGFSSNIRIKYGGHRDLLRKITNENLTNFYAHWENCQLPAAKAFRAMYKRPYFLPSAVEMSSTNWVFISSNYTAKIFKEVDIGHPLVILMQVKGEIEIKVDTWKPCDTVCTSLEDVLQEGEILILTDSLWRASYLPLPERDSISIGIGGFFD
ncbi:hypothetical protein C0Q70_14028 [Pomacea canaliculata]|uniref:Uncharacterized protein n=1 Tax=Pomacea canaliculata TaxID=400727 RepID=A0A2T7NYX8_POMCA|nr:uncharacterized protein LOC112569816 [Pomacea canaliculata]PVD26356.1 hypothetical protein C0Q70_14028 [Pomacea canaliculata]